MQSKILVASLLAATFAVGGLASNEQPIHAKSYATIQSTSYMSTNGTKRNVAPTGSNALYTRPGTTKGAKVVASTTTMGKLGNSKYSKDYFRAYSQATTSRNSVYYKVVSFDGKYRGWVYGGKVSGQFNGGIVSANTTQAVTLDSSVTQNQYYLLKSSASVTRNYPTMTQYKVKKMMTDPSPYFNTPLTVNKAVKRTREGSTYYYVTSSQYPNINGWIWEGYLYTKDNDNGNGNNGSNTQMTVFNALSSADVTVSPSNENTDQMYRVFYATQYPDANAYQYNASDQSTANQNKIREILGDGKLVQADSTHPAGRISVSFDSNGKAHVTITLQDESKLIPNIEYNLTGDTKMQEEYKDGVLYSKSKVYTDSTDAELYEQLAGLDSSDGKYYYSYRIDNNTIMKSEVTITAKRDANGLIVEGGLTINFGTPQKITTTD